MTANDTLPPWFTPVELITSYSFMAAACITLPLYWIEIIVLISMRNSFYKGMFYRIFTIGIIVDMISLCNNYLGCIFPAKGWFTAIYLSTGTEAGKLYLVVAWTSRVIQGCTVVSLALNRMTAVCVPMRHKRIWNSKYASLITLFQLGIGPCIGFRLVRQNFYWKHENNGIYIQFEDSKFRLNFFISAYIIETLFVLIIIVINIIMMCYFKKKYKMRRVNLPQNSQYNQKVVGEKQRQENNLTIVAVLTCGAEITYYVYVIYVFGINTNVPTRIFYLLYNAINDIYSGLSGWLIVIYSRAMRAHILKMLRTLVGFRTMDSPLKNIVSSATQLEGRANSQSARRVRSAGTQC